MITCTKMRDLMSVTRIRSLRKGLDPTLAETFKKPRGRIGTKRMDQMSHNDARELHNSLYRITNYETISTFPEGLNTIQNWLNSKGKKNSRIIIAHLKKCGFDTNRAEFQGWTAEWQAKFLSTPCEYEIAWDVDAFDRVGTFSGVDAYGKSCYRPEGEWRDGPVTLAGGLWSEQPTFVVFLRKGSDAVRARCWGFIAAKPYEHNAIYLSNGYYGEGMPSDIAIFVRAIECAIGTPMTFKRIGDGQNWPLYVNGDTAMVYASTADAPDHEEGHDLNSYECVADGCHRDTSESNGYQHPFCGHCLDDEGTDCHACGDRVGEGDQYHCSHCEETYCESCYYDDHYTCENCSEVTCQEQHTVHVASRYGYGEETWCDDCVDNASEVKTCDECSTLYTGDECPDECGVEEEEEEEEKEEENKKELEEVNG